MQQRLLNAYYVVRHCSEGDQIPDIVKLIDSWENNLAHENQNTISNKKQDDQKYHERQTKVRG